MIRLKPAELILTSAPGWEEAEGRPVQRGESDIDIAEVEVRFRGRPNAEHEAREAEPEVIEIEDTAERRPRPVYEVRRSMLEEVCDTLTI